MKVSPSKKTRKRHYKFTDLCLLSISIYGHKNNFESLNNPNHVSCVMISVLTSSVVGRGFEPRSGQTKNYKIGICSFSAQH